MKKTFASVLSSTCEPAETYPQSDQGIYSSIILSILLILSKKVNPVKKQTQMATF